MHVGIPASQLHPAESCAHAAMTDLCAGDLLRPYGLEHDARWTRRVRPLAARFARQVLEFDRVVAHQGLDAAGRWVLARYTRSLTPVGVEHVPRSGPVVVAANHPGMADAMGLWVAMGRADVRILAKERGLLEMLPGVKPYLILIDDQGAGALREAIGHLRSGGALLTFPGGRIEPDPRVRPGLLEALAEWSPSLKLLERRAPETRFVPALVQGAISRTAVRLAGLRRFASLDDRDWAGAGLQALLPPLRRVGLQVRFGAPVGAQAIPTAVGRLLG